MADTLPAIVAGGQMDVDTKSRETAREKMGKTAPGPGACHQYRPGNADGNDGENGS